MQQEFQAENDTDLNGNPTGSTVRSVGLAIDWQNGPLGRGDERIEPNGAFIETVIAAAKQRLEFSQEVSGGKFTCGENKNAIWHLGRALASLNARTASREARQVEGTHEA